MVQAFLETRPASTEERLNVPACLERVRRGDDDAAQALLNHLYPLVISIVRGHLPRRSSEEDLAQMVFVKVFAKLEQFSGTVPLEHWVSRIAVNTCRQLLRKRPKAGVVSLDEPEFGELADPAAPPWQEVVRADEEQAVRRLVAELPEDYRVVLVLRYFQEMSYEEMVRVLNWTLPQVKIKLHRARRAFAARYARSQESLGGER